MASNKKGAKTGASGSFNKNMKVKRDAPEEAAAPATKGERKKAAKKTLSKTAKIVLVVIGCAAMLLSVTAMACSGVLNEATNQEDYQLTGGVAGTVNGVNITEDTVTKQIMGMRTSMGYDDDAAWAQYLVDQGMTPESYREQVIRSLAREYLMTEAVTTEGITVSDEEIQEAWDSAVEQYGDEETFKQLLSAMGYDEDSYKETLKSQLEQDKLEEKVAPAKDATDEEILSYFNENFDTYNDARRSENLLIKVASDASDEDKASAKEKAEDIKKKIDAGELSFEDAVDQYSEDEGSKENKGDVGWDRLTSFVTEYQQALNGLKKGEVSDVVETSYGYHLIKCTDTFKLDGKATKIDQLPGEYQTYIGNVVKTQSQQTAYSEWLNDYVDKADVQINDMPADVPYNVSLDGVTPSTSGSAASAASGSSEN